MLLDESHAQLRQEEERGSSREACACGAEDWPKRAAGARAATLTGGRRRRGDSAGDVADVEAPRLARGGGSRWSGTNDWPEPACEPHCSRALERAYGWHQHALAGLVHSSVPNSVW